MKGIILAGGNGTRLYPSTQSVCKQLLPVYDKPMIYYPLATLMLANIREILIISTLRDIDKFRELFKDGSGLGISIEYAVQEKPKGIAEAFIIGEKFIGMDSVTLILGDNIFWSIEIENILESASRNNKGGIVFGYPVDEPCNFGVVELDGNNKPVCIKEKPKNPTSNLAVPGLYFYDNKVVDIAKSIRPSHRGELEITDINNEYIKNKDLEVIILDNSMTWFDTGTHESMLKASMFVHEQVKNNVYIGAIEEVAYNKKFISKQELCLLIKELGSTKYGEYLKNIE